MNHPLRLVLASLLTSTLASGTARGDASIGAGFGVGAGADLADASPASDAAVSAHARAGRWLTSRLALEGRAALDAPLGDLGLARITAGPSLRALAAPRLTVGATVGLTATSYAAGGLIGLDGAYTVGAGTRHALDLVVELRALHGGDVSALLGTVGLGWHLE